MKQKLKLIGTSCALLAFLCLIASWQLPHSAVGAPQEVNQWPGIDALVLTNGQVSTGALGSRVIPVKPDSILVVQPIVRAGGATTSNVVFLISSGLFRADFSTNYALSFTATMNGTNRVAPILIPSLGTNIPAAYISLDTISAATSLTTQTVERVNYFWLPR